MLFVVFSILGLMALLAALQMYQAKNYLDPNGPCFSGNFAEEIPNLPETLTVISYNISYGEKIDQALSEIKEIRSRNGLDILLLQEMDEVGTERVARELQMNYVYYPATIEPKYHKNFGNAVSSRWPIIDSKKIILPHISLSDHMKRIATRATIRVRDFYLYAYCLHTEPVFILPRFKENQCTAVLNDIPADAKFAIIAGDYNSFTQTNIERLEKYYQQAGFVRASKGCGHTFARFGIQVPPDHIFTKGFVVKDTGKMADATASDHLPVWVILEADEQPELEGTFKRQKQGL